MGTIPPGRPIGVCCLEDGNVMGDLDKSIAIGRKTTTGGLANQ